MRANTVSTEEINRRLREAAALHRRGDVNGARGQYEELRRLEPRQPDAMTNIAMGLAQVGRIEPAIETLRACIAAHPSFLDAYVVLANVLGMQQRFVDAEACMRAALRINPNIPDFHHLLAKTLHRQGREADAEAAYRAAFALGLRTPEILIQCSEILIETAKLDDAEPLLEEALQKAPGNANALTALGRVAELRGDTAKAVDLHDRAIKADPSNANAHVNRGTAKRFGGDLDGALADFNQALALKPGFPPAIASRGITLLSAGRLREGWSDFRARLTARPGARDHSGGKAWNGAPLDGRKVLVWTEYGLGDEIMAAGLLPDLIDRVAHCTVACTPRLISLFQRAFPAATIVSADEPIDGDFDARLPLMDTAAWLRPDFASFTRRDRYLTADPDRTQGLRHRYSPDGAPLVGIAWRSAAPGMGVFKSAPLAHWKNILGAPGVRFVSLQYGADTAEIAAAGIDIIRDPTIDPVSDLESHAAQIAAMDLVISVSNTAVHLAGALGKPTWLLVPEDRGAHWYWFKNRSDSPWYPGLRLFRQHAPGDWRGPIADITGALQTWPRS